MELIEKEENYCRICLKNEAFFDWSEQIFEFHGPTYQECYYQFTQLQRHGKKIYNVLNDICQSTTNQPF